MNKKVNVLIGLSFLFLLILGGAYAFSKYRSSASGTASAEVAKWDILVNDCNIVDPDDSNTDCFTAEVLDQEGQVIQASKNFKITDFTYSNNGNNNVVDTKIVPGSSGSFAIVIKPTDTEVSFKYSLNASLVDENDSIKLYVKGPGDTNRIELNSSNSNTYTRTVNYNDFKNNPNYSVTVNVYVDWLNKADGSNDEADTKIGTSGSTPKLVIPVNIVFEQVK